MPSLEGQIDRRFRWVLLTDNTTVDSLERDRRRFGMNGTDWYRFAAIEGRDVERHYVPRSLLDRAFGNWTAVASTVDHLITTYLDVDDALPVDYMALVHQWYASGAAEWPQDEQRGACSARAFRWVPDARERLGLFYAEEDTWAPRGCFASGIVIARPVADTLTEKESPILGPHFKIHLVHPGVYTTIDRPLFRVRSVTSVGGKHVRHELATNASDMGTVYVRPNVSMLVRDFNIQGRSLAGLNNHLVKHAHDIANEILTDRAARGCNTHFNGSCGKNFAVATAILQHASTGGATPPDPLR